MAVGKDGPATPGPEGGARVEDGDAPDGYENLTRIDQGGFAVVYRARDTRFDRTVALKILRADSLGKHQLRRFRAECLAIGRVCSHPNIVTVYDAGTTRDHRPWLAMEYCSGGSLAHRLARVGPLPVSEVVSIGARLCGALSAAHGAGILHRDVKPRNVLLTSYGEPALADFGIATVAAEDDNMTETAAYTVVHAAPEILEGRAGTAAADVYSLGSTLYTLLAGQAPFAREASTGLAPLVTRILRNDLPVITRHGVPPELEKLLRRSMSARPQDRPTSAELGASLTSLGHLLNAVEAPLPPTREPPEPMAPPISARRLPVILGGTVAALAALAAVVMAVMAWGPGSDRDEPRQNPSNGPAAGTGQAAPRYAPTGLAVAGGRSEGELIVSWNMPIRPDVVATVIYQGPGTTRARAIFNYGTSPTSTPHVTMRGLPAGRTVCLSAAHVVSIDNKITNAVSRPVCAAPR